MRRTIESCKSCNLVALFATKKCSNGAYFKGKLQSCKIPKNIKINIYIYI